MNKNKRTILSNSSSKYSNITGSLSIISNTNDTTEAVTQEKTVEIIGDFLYRWDTGRKLKISSSFEYFISEVHFSNSSLTNTLSVATYEQDGILMANIPNILLQENSTITVYLVTVSENETRTVYKSSFSIQDRPKPNDYVYTEIELLNYEKVTVELLEQLRKNNEQIDLLKEAVATADSYIGDYQYKELMYEFTEEDFLVKTPVFETEILTALQAESEYWLPCVTTFNTNETFIVSINGKEAETINMLEDSDGGIYFVCDNVIWRLDSGGYFYTSVDNYDTVPTIYLVRIDRNSDVAVKTDAEFVRGDVEVEFCIRSTQYEDEAIKVVLTKENFYMISETSNSYIKSNSIEGETASGSYVYAWVGFADGFDMTKMEKGDFTGLDIYTEDCIVDYVRVYKVHDKLSPRIAEILDEINGEVI